MRYWIFILTVIFLSSCVKELQIDLNESNPNRPVMSGKVSNHHSSNYIQLTKTMNFSDAENTKEFINDAEIYVINNGAQTNFVHSENLYLPVNNLELVPGEAQLVVKHQNNEYQYTTQIMQIPTVDYFLADPNDGVSVDINLIQGNEFFLAELEVDSTGTGTKFEKDLYNFPNSIFRKYEDEVSDVYSIYNLWAGTLVENQSPLLYRFTLHRISQDQFDYLNAIQNQPTGNLNHPTPNNIPFLFSNEGIGIVFLSSTYVQEFSM